jgi:hypothetical protein
MSGLLLRDAWLCLALERSRAPSLRVALSQWLEGQRCRLKRLRRLGVHQMAVLARAEAECAQSGFSAASPVASGAAQGIVAPWHLPESALASGAVDWLVHPLLDTSTPDWRAPSLPGATRLRHHLVSGRSADRWAGLPGLASRGRPGSAARLAVVLHLYYPELWSELWAALRQLPEPCDLYITVPDFASTGLLAGIAAQAPGVRFVPGPNRGRDVLPWLRLLDTGALDGYEWVCKLHTKRSPHMADGEAWRQKLVSGLLGAPGEVHQILKHLRARPHSGVAAPAQAVVASDDPRWAGSSLPALRRVRQQLGLSAEDKRDAFPAGTMFWFRPEALAGLKPLARAQDLFEPEMRQTDGTTAHAVERLIVTIALRNGFELTTF